MAHRGPLLLVAAPGSAAGARLSNRAIAARLSITERTVEAHVTGILPKLDLREGPNVHRRVLAALAFVEGTRPDG